MTTTKILATDWPKIRVQYHGPHEEEIISLEQAVERFELDRRTVDSLRNRRIAGTSVNKSDEKDSVDMIYVYSREDSIRDASPELLEAIEALLAIPVCRGHLPHIDQQRARQKAHAAIAKVERR